MTANLDLECFAERCLKAVGLGPIFRIVIKHDTSFDSVGFTTNIIKPKAEQLGFVCKVVDLSRFTSIYEATNELGEIEGLLTSCDDEQRPLIVFQNTEHLLDQRLTAFHTRLRGILDCFDSTAVIFLSSQEQSINKLFNDSSMPFYNSAAILDLED